MDMCVKVPRRAGLWREVDGWTGARMRRGGQARVQTPMTGQKCAQRDGGTSTLEPGVGWVGWGGKKGLARYLGTWVVYLGRGGVCSGPGPL